MKFTLSIQYSFTFVQVTDAQNDVTLEKVGKFEYLQNLRKKQTTFNSQIWERKESNKHLEICTHSGKLVNAHTTHNG